MKHLATSLYALSMLALVLFASAQTNADQDGTPACIQGIGYAKIGEGSAEIKNWRENNGIGVASWAGGTKIRIKADCLDSNPANNVVVFVYKSTDGTSIPFYWTLKTSDMIGSNTGEQELIVTAPSLKQLMGESIVKAFFSNIDYITFTIHIEISGKQSNCFSQDPNFGGNNQGSGSGDGHGTNGEEDKTTIGCPSTAKAACQFKYSLRHTPVIYYLNPPVVYQGLEVDVHYNSKGITTQMQLTSSDSKPIVKVGLGDSLIQFHDDIAKTTIKNTHARQFFVGVVTDKPHKSNFGISMLWEGIGESIKQETEMKTCDFNGNNCYEVKHVPVIRSIDQKGGWRWGEQRIVIRGYGFKVPMEKIKVVAAGTDCEVRRVNHNVIVCFTQEVNRDPVTGPQVGQHGVRRSLILNSKWNNPDTLQSVEPTKNVIAMSMVAPTNTGHYYSNLMKAWFIAPATGEFRFHGNCDDHCDLWFSKEKDISEFKEGGVERVIDINQWIPLRRYFTEEREGQNRASDWFQLEKGEKYYMEARHSEGGGGDHMSFGVEYKTDATENHHHANKEVQEIGVSIEQKYEEWEVEMNNLDGKLFVLKFEKEDGTGWDWVNPDSDSNPKPLKAGKNNWYEFRNHINNYYWKVHRGRTKFEVLEMKLADGTVTTNLNDHKNAVSVKYKFTFLKMSKIKAIKAWEFLKPQTEATAAEIKFTKIQDSGPPLTGKYKVVCVDAMGAEHETLPIPSNAHEGTVRHRIENDCPGFYETLQVWEENYAYNDRANGFKFRIRFSGLNKNPGQFYIKSDDDEGLRLDMIDPPDDKITFIANTPVEFGKNLFWDLIPFEWLKTYETKPQIIVTVDGQPAVCHDLNCEYEYLTSTGSVTSFTYVETTRILTIIGVSLPAIADITEIEFADAKCTIDTAASSETTIKCTLNEEETCGKWLPIIRTANGRVKVKGVAKLAIGCIITKCNKIKNINVNGGDYIECDGKRFPKQHKKIRVQSRWSNSLASRCMKYRFLNRHKFRFRVRRFRRRDTNKQYTLTHTINEETVKYEQQITFQTIDKYYKIIYVQRLSVSPVLRTLITIGLDIAFPLTVSTETMEMYVSKWVPDENAMPDDWDPVETPVAIVEADNSAKTIKCKFQGAWSGKYFIRIKHKETGIFDDQDIYILHVGAEYTHITPSFGSIYGGTLITIKGSNFGTVPTDNPVALWRQGKQNINCLVESSAETEIICRIQPIATPLTIGDKAKLIVFLKTYEEAKCDVKDENNQPTNCMFTFQEPTAEVTGIQKAWNGECGCYEIIISGTGFSGTPSQCGFTIRGWRQKIITVTTTTIKVQVTTIGITQLKQMELFTLNGRVKGWKTISDTLFELEPKFTGLDDNDGSVGGQSLIAFVAGIGVDTTGIDLVDPNGNSICDSVKIEESGKVICETKAVAMAEIDIRFKYGSIFYECASSVVSKCKYKQVTGSNKSPFVTTIRKIDNQVLELVGDFFDFIEDNWEIDATFRKHITVKNCRRVTRTTIRVTFDDGLPILDDGEFPVLRFRNKHVRHRFHRALFQVVWKNMWSITNETPDVKCGFEGGCLLTINAPGLSLLMKQAACRNWVKVCYKECKYRHDLSNPVKAVCEVPEFMNYKSKQLFKGPRPKKGKWLDLEPFSSFGNMINNGHLIDRKYRQTWPTDPMTNGQPLPKCHVGVEFPPGKVAEISWAKFFIKYQWGRRRFGNRRTYNRKLQFQGSNDGITYDHLHTVRGVRNGWNFIKWHRGRVIKKYPQYRFYRFYSEGGEQFSCKVNDLRLRGLVFDPTELSTKVCDVDLFVWGRRRNLKTRIIYGIELTAKITRIFPSIVSVKGGTIISIYGENFSTVREDYEITIDGIKCAVRSVSEGLVKCRVGAKKGLNHSGGFKFNILGRGLASTEYQSCEYANFWSDRDTWGGEFLPVEGEMVYIPPGLTLLVDIDFTPKLKAILVEGKLIFKPHPTDKNYEKFFDCGYIFIRNGHMEVGTELEPYTSKLYITLHGLPSDPAIPIYGSKCIGVRFGILEMYGMIRDPYWTKLHQTALKGATKIQMMRSVDWMVGEKIVIAPTSFGPQDAETRVITKVTRADPEKPWLFFDEPLEFDHYAGFEDYEGKSIDLRGEVGLLTRNLVVRGDMETSEQNAHGANLFIHSEGDDSVIARLANVEFYRVGQRSAVGRFAIHFHMVGMMPSSYAIGCVVHESYNRGFSLHGVHNVRLQENICYDVEGHNFVIKDGIETDNVLDQNLVVSTKRAWSLMNTDMTPAGFWITNPDNHLTGNNVGGSAEYGFWYDLPKHPVGPSATNDRCPMYAAMGTFDNNTAHSTHRYGLRVWHYYIPREKECEPIEIDYDYWKHTPALQPYHNNEPLSVSFTNFTGYKNLRNGAIAGTVGKLRFLNFKVADNYEAGIEFEDTSPVIGFYQSGVNNALVIAKSKNDLDGTHTPVTGYSPFGVIAARSEWMMIKDVVFVNFDFNKSAALGDCSHCFWHYSTDSGARTTYTEKLVFVNVRWKIRHQYPFTGIFHDEDGSLTGLGKKSYATRLWPHLDVSECTKDNTNFENEILCPPEAPIRRVSFHNQYPAGPLRGLPMYITRMDNDQFNQQSGGKEAAIKAYLDNRENYTKIPQKGGKDPSNAWTAAFVTGHKYKWHIGVYGADFLHMNYQLSEHWNPNTDKNIIMINNFTDVRARFNVSVDGNPVSVNLPNSNDYTPATTFSSAGAFKFWNQDDIATSPIPNRKNYHILLSAKGPSKEYYKRREISVRADRCIGPCQQPNSPGGVAIGPPQLWSVASSWTNGIPGDGDDVEIPEGKHIVFDLPDDETNTIIFNKIIIRGKLSFKNVAGLKLHLRCKNIFNMGIFHIGSGRLDRFLGFAKITLYGTREEQYIVHDNQIEGGNKIISNVGEMKFYGQPRIINRCRLHKIANKGDTQITIQKNLNFVEDDVFVLAGTGYSNRESEKVTIKSYDPTTGICELKSALKFYHWGKETSTVSEFGIDIRGEVALLTRNILIQGHETESYWGCQILTGTFENLSPDFQIFTYTGWTHMNNVEISGCSQAESWRSAVRFAGVAAPSDEKKNTVEHCAIHDGLGWGIYVDRASKVFVFQNTIFNFRQTAIYLSTVNDVQVIGNWVMGVYGRKEFVSADAKKDHWTGISTCTLTKRTTCTNIKVANNIVSGATWAGFTGLGHRCGQSNTQQVFRHNVAHSIMLYPDGHPDWGNLGLGMFILPDWNDETQKQESCSETSQNFAYKVVQGIAWGYQTGFNTIIGRKLTAIDCGTGYIAAPAHGKNTVEEVVGKHYEIKLYANSGIPDCQPGQQCVQITKSGILVPTIYHGGLPIPPNIRHAPAPEYQDRDGSYNGHSEFHNCEFYGYSKQTDQGKRQSAIRVNLNPDIVQPTFFINSIFEDCDKQALMYIPAPLQKWAIIRDCGNFPCTGLNNVLIKFEGTQFKGVTTHSGLTFTSKWQVISNNAGFSPFINRCSLVDRWNAYVCNQPTSYLAQIVFENLDADSKDRAIQPVWVQQQNSEINNKLNAFMDHCWEGYYTCQKRTGRFPSLVNAQKGLSYDLFFDGYPADNFRFKLFRNLVTSNNQAGITVRIHYRSAVTRGIKANGVFIPENDWDENERGPEKIKQRKCGENRYIGVQNILEFYLTPSCNIQIVKKDSIKCKVRMQWSLVEFFANGGTTRFVDRLATTLGLHASQVKIVSVYEGSLVVDYNLLPDESSSTAAEDLKKIEAKQTELMAKGKLDLGAPILDSSVGGGSIVQNGVVTAEGYEPIIITQTKTNSQAGIQINSNSNSGSSSSGSGSSSNKPKYDVKTGTKKEYSEYKAKHNIDFFDKIKLAKEEGKIDEEMAEKLIKSKLEEDLQESKSKTAAVTKTISETASKQSNEGTVFALIGVIVALIIGIVVYAIVNYVRKTQNEQMINPRSKAYAVEGNETEFGTNKKDESIAELPRQFDAHMVYQDPNSACKMMPGDNSTINDLVRGDENDTERNKSVIEGSSGLDAGSTTSGKSNKQNKKKKTQPKKKQSTTVQQNEDIEIEESNSGSHSDIYQN